MNDERPTAAELDERARYAERRASLQKDPLKAESWNCLAAIYEAESIIARQQADLRMPVNRYEHFLRWAYGDRLKPVN